MIQDHNGEIWIAGKRGLIRYDGREWLTYPTSTAVFSLAVSDDNVLYFAGRGLFGYVDSDSLEAVQIVDLPQIASEDIISMLWDGVQLLMCSEDHFYRYLPGSAELSQTSPPVDVQLDQLFKIEEDVLIRSQTDGWYALDDNELFEAAMPDSIVWMDESEDEKLTALSVNGFIEVTFDNDETVELIFDEKNKDYLKESGPLEVSWIDNELMAISTLSGGVVFVHFFENRISEIVNYRTGLPDNQVTRIIVDQDKSVWVLHEYGLSRISPLLPVRDFSKFPGLEGNVLKVAKRYNLTYAATSTGLFVLDLVKDFKEEIVYEKVVITEKINQPEEDEPDAVEAEALDEPAAEEIVPSDSAQTGKKKKGLFSFLKKKDRKKKKGKDADKKDADVQVTEAEVDVDVEEVSETSEEEKIDDLEISQSDQSDSVKKKKNFFKNIFKKNVVVATEQQLEEIPEEEWRRKVDRELLAVRYVYKRVSGIPTKIEELTTSETGIFAGGLSGIYHVKDSMSIKIAGFPIRKMFFSEENDLLLFSTLTDQNSAYQLVDQEWMVLTEFEEVDQTFVHFVETKEGFWMMGQDSLFHFTYSDEEFTRSGAVHISNPFYEDSEVTVYQDKLVVVNSSGLYEVEMGSYRVNKWDNIAHVDQYFSIQDKGIWYRLGLDWYFIGDTENVEALKFLNLFPDSRYIASSTRNDTYLVVTRDNNIYEVDASDPQGFASDNVLFLKNISDSEQSLKTRGRLKITQGFNSLSFQFIKPDYTGLSSISYRYRIVGLNNEWSDWSTENNTISFSYIPSGKYTLEAQSRNMLGNIENMEPYSFTVVPPYWRTAWFYAIEVLIFSLLLYFSIRLNRTRHRFRIISRLLAFLTLILLVEFVQTVAEYYFETETSPVFNFFIQVLVAFMVLPFESILRRLIFRADTAESS